MKYLTPLIVLVLVAGTAYATYVFAPNVVEDCCEYLGLLAPEGVSETPGVEHVDFEDPTADGNIPDTLPGLKLDDSPEAFTLPDINGKQHTVEVADGKLTLVVWVSSFCPTSKIYETRLNALAAEFPAIRCWGINSSAMESVEELQAHFNDGDADRLTWTVLKDDRNVIADRFGARASAEVFVFDGEGKLQYRGGIDDARNMDRVEVQYLRVVLKQLSEGKKPEWHYQPAKGCCPIDKLGAEESQPEPSAQ